MGRHGYVFKHTGVYMYLNIHLFMKKGRGPSLQSSTRTCEALITIFSSESSPGFLSFFLFSLLAATKLYFVFYQNRQDVVWRTCQNAIQEHYGDTTRLQCQILPELFCYFEKVKYEN